MEKSTDPSSQQDIHTHFYILDALIALCGNIQLQLQTTMNSSLHGLGVSYFGNQHIAVIYTSL